MMGTGKSTVGKLVSKALGYHFFDTDELIENLAGPYVGDTHPTQPSPHKCAPPILSFQRFSTAP